MEKELKPDKMKMTVSNYLDILRSNVDKDFLNLFKNSSSDTSSDSFIYTTTTGVDNSALDKDFYIKQMNQTVMNISNNLTELTHRFTSFSETTEKVLMLLYKELLETRRELAELKKEK